MGKLQGVIVDIKGMSAEAVFEVIEIIDDSNPYPMLLRIDWATDMNGVINLKRCKMIFENKSVRVVEPLDPTKRTRLLGPYNTSACPITIVVIPLIYIVVPILPQYCYFCVP